MAVRRSFQDLRDGGDPNAEDDFARGPAGTSIMDLFDATGGDSGGPGAQPDGGGALADRSAPAMPPGPPVGAGEVGGGEGNRESPREVFGGHTNAAAPGAPPNLAEIMSLLPRGVEAQSPEQMGSGAEMAPSLNAEPAPTSAHSLGPATVAGTAPSVGGSSSPQRQSFSSPSALFSGGGGSALSRQGGGFGLPGMSQGPARPTEQMLQLLRSLGLGGGQ